MPVQANELVLLGLGFGILAFLLINPGSWRRLPHSRLLILAFLMPSMAWVFTVLESFVWPETFDLLEHIFDALAGVFLLLWLHAVCRPARSAG